MHGLQTDWYTISNINELDSPALVVYPARIKQNIATAIAMLDDITRLRPHVKTNKCAEVCSMMINAGISKFKCATIAEAEMLGMIKAKDVLLAYQPTGPKLKRFMDILHEYPYTSWSCLVDNTDSAKEISSLFTANDLTATVYLDLNIGMNRTGIEAGPKAFDLYKVISVMPAIKIAGLHVYDGHITDPDIEKRTRQCDEAFSAATALKEQIIAAGHTTPIIIAGGSPSFPIHAKRKDVECSPGTFIYWDKSYLDNCAEQSFVPAAVLVTRVISKPAESIISIDLGHKSVAAENILTKRAFLMNANELTPQGQSEEHLVLKAGDEDQYAIGDVLYALPFHICPTVALYEKVYTVENGMVNGSWKNIARDRMINC